MEKNKSRFRRPTPDEQTVLSGITVKLLVTPQDIRQCDQILIEHHYLHSASWWASSSATPSFGKANGWRWRLGAPRPCTSRRGISLLAGPKSSGASGCPWWSTIRRLYVLAQCHYPNLVSRFMKLMLARLSQDWESTWGHPVVLAESFVDPQQYRGTAYKVSGWSQLGPTSGWKRSAVDFYEKHDRPKQVWVRELVKNACVKLRARSVPPPWACVLRQRRAPLHGQSTARSPV